MKQKLALCCALIHRPRVLLLDEPTTGVDAVSRREFWDMLTGLKEEGITIFVSTPYMDEASRCERVALIQNGKIMQVGQPTEITAAFPSSLYSIQAENTYQLLQALRSYPFAESVHAFGESVHYTDKRPALDEADLHKHLEEAGLDRASIQVINPNIEDCFMQLMTAQ